MADTWDQALGDATKALDGFVRETPRKLTSIAKIGEIEARRAAPVRTGRLQASIRGVTNRRDRQGITYPENYEPINSGVPSRGIPAARFAEAGIDKMIDEWDGEIRDLSNAVLGR